MLHFVNTRYFSDFHTSEDQRQSELLRCYLGDRLSPYLTMRIIFFNKGIISSSLKMTSSYETLTPLWDLNLIFVDARHMSLSTISCTKVMMPQLL